MSESSENLPSSATGAGSSVSVGEELTQTLANPIPSTNALADSTFDLEQIFAMRRYGMVRSLGQGGMGTVSLVEDRLLGRKVAMKQPRIDGGQSSALEKSLVHEARLVSNLRHPNLPSIHDIQRDENGSVFYTMQYHGELDLAKVIHLLRSGDAHITAHFSPLRRLQVFRSLLSALGFAHAQKILHRDIKPSNIMVGLHGEVTLIDWGLASRKVTGYEAEEGIGSADRVLGTPLYASPEQVSGFDDAADVDERSDLYSLFVVLFELLTLQRYVTKGGTLSETLERVRNIEVLSVADPRFAPEGQEPVPKELRYFLIKGLSPLRSDRYASAEAALEELDRIDVGNFRMVCSVTCLKKTLRSVEHLLDRYPTAVIFTLILGAVVLFGLAGIGLQSAWSS